MTDIATVVNKVKDLASGTVIKPRAQVQPAIPVTTANVNVLDIANTVDAVSSRLIRSRCRAVRKECRKEPMWHRHPAGASTAGSPCRTSGRVAHP